MYLDKLKRIERELYSILLELLRAEPFDQKAYFTVCHIYELVLDVINEQDDDDWITSEWDD